ncbi:uncharacterized protein LOC122081920 [Macadamia integrifolia]|uniref:uncharacterized protein LOC122081920 n=1 Tax=Macadamia integrifolia TaxID=60698 RepID=UPI001C4FD356|nr:uncharacterized protein LOC122081920 [Macadamia integrifolia]
MEFHAEQHTVSGNVPDFGAIFMSNCSTKKECFRNKVFGLPSHQSNFVKKVRDGMFLFLFEYEKRELYGVFQASSNGAMNIAPDAFQSIGKQFPAQICFRTIWLCDPLKEYDFRDAIKENYFSTYKFNFGLSEDQVDRLLWLFESRIVKDLRTPILVTRTKVSKHFKISNWDSRFLKTYREENNLNMGSGIEPYDVTRNRGLPMPREENNLMLDSSIEPFDPSGNHGFRRLNLDSSGYSDKFPLDKNDSLLKGYRRLSTGNRLEEPLVSNMFASKSHGDAIMPSSQPVGTPGVDFRHSESPSVQYRRSLSFGQGSSLNLGDRIHPSSEGQLAYSHAERKNFKLSQSRCHNLDGSTKLGDFIPLSISPDHYELSSSGTPSSGAGYLQNKTIGVTNLEHYEGLSYPDNPLPFMRNGDHGRTTTKSSHFAFIPDKSSPYVSDYGLPAASQPDYVYEASRYRRYEGSMASAPFSDQSHQPKDGYDLESQNYDYYEKSDQSFGNKGRISMGLHSDNQEKRSSVFSRLCAAKPGTGQLSGNYGYIVDMTSEELKVLRHGYNSPRKTIWKPKPFIARQGDDENFENTTQTEMIVDAAFPNEGDGWSSEEVAQDTPVINFKRRSEVRNLPSKTKASSCIEGEKHKRRKLVRPTFSPILQLSSQETLHCNGNKGSESEEKSKSSDLSGRIGGGKVSQKDSSETDSIQNAGCPVSFEGNSGYEDCSRIKDSKVEMLCREIFGNSCSCPKCDGSSQGMCEDNGKAGRGELLIKSDGDKIIEKGLPLTVGMQNAVCGVSSEFDNDAAERSSGSKRKQVYKKELVDVCPDGEVE